MWIGTQKSKNKSQISWNILSHDETGKDNNNFHIKIRKMEAKLNICPNAVGGRTLLGKSLGLSQLINSSI